MSNTNSKYMYLKGQYDEHDDGENIEDVIKNIQGKCYSCFAGFLYQLISVADKN